MYHPIRQSPFSAVTIGVLLTLFTLDAELAKSQSIVPITVFDTEDRIIDTVSAKVSHFDVIDTAGKYHFRLLPANANLSSRSNRKDTVLVFARREGGVLRPIFDWSDYRIFLRDSRLATTRWEGLSEGERARSIAISYPPRGSAVRGLWGVRVPAHLAAATKIQIYVCRRPVWQRAFANEMLVASTGHEVEFEVNRAPATYSYRMKLVGAGSISYVSRIPTANDAAQYIYLPREPMIAGDEVTLTETLTPTTITWGCPGGTTGLFPRVAFKSRGDEHHEPVMCVNVGGETTSPHGFTRIRGQITLPDGDRIDFEGSTRVGCSIEWPGHSSTDGAIVTVVGQAIGPSGPTSLATTSYAIDRVDKAFSISPHLLPVRLDLECSVQPLEFGGTIMVVNWPCVTGAACNWRPCHPRR